MSEGQFIGKVAMQVAPPGTWWPLVPPDGKIGNWNIARDTTDPGYKDLSLYLKLSFQLNISYSLLRLKHISTYVVFETLRVRQMSQECTATKSPKVTFSSSFFIFSHPILKTTFLTNTLIILREGFRKKTVFFMVF